MYKIIGTDGKEYGPVSLEQMRQWITQGRVNAGTRVLPPGSADWRNASEIPELQAFLNNRVAPDLASPAVGPQKRSLAITSLVLGILSIFCLGVITGIPAIITGHMAHGRARKHPDQYGGAGLAMVGFILGYLSIVITLIGLAVLLPGLSAAKAKATRDQCFNNLTKIGTACQMWAMEHDDRLPFGVSTNEGGTLELVSTNAQGVASDPSVHLRLLGGDATDLDPGVFVCPKDNKPKARSFDALQSGNISYQLRTVPGIARDPDEVLMICPLHELVLRPDGSVQSQ